MPEIIRRPPLILPDLARGNRTVFLGDSITIGASDIDGNDVKLGRDSYATLLCLISNNRIRYCHNAGVGSENTADMLARLSADVIAKSPAKCVIMGGTNDIGNSVTETTTHANLTAIHRQLRAAGIEAIFCTIPPRSTKPAETAALNRWIRRYCEQNGLHCVDFYSMLSDGTSGGWRNGSAWSSDGVHPWGTIPQHPAVQAMAEYANTILSPVYPVHQPDLTGDNINGTGNLVVAGCFQTDTNADGVADNWAISGSGGTVTPSIESGDPNIAGNWQVLTVTAAGSRSITQTISTGFSDGDRIAVSFRLTTEGVEAGDGMTCTVGVRMSGAAGGPYYIQPVSSLVYNVDNKIGFAEGVVPTGTTSLQAEIINGSGNTGATAVVKVAQFTVLNLTVLGLV